MTSLPYPKPTTREMARKNAILYAEEAAMHMQPGGMMDLVRANLEAAKTWAAIAATFPEDHQFETVLADDRPVSSYLGGGTEPVDNAEGFPDNDSMFRQDPDATSVMPLGRPSVGHVEASGQRNGTIMVDALAWDILRFIAVRHVLSSLSRGMSIDVEAEMGTEGWDLQFSRMPDSPVVHVSVQPTS